MNLNEIQPVPIKALNDDEIFFRATGLTGDEWIQQDMLQAGIGTMASRTRQKQLQAEIVRGHREAVEADERRFSQALEAMAGA